MTDAIREKAIEAAARALLENAPGNQSGALLPFEEQPRSVQEKLIADATVVVDAFEAAMWQPMESARKSGKTVLLGLRNRLGNWRTFCGCWLSQTDIDDDFEEPKLFKPGWYETAEETEECWPVSPTHWRPLPLPPKEENKP